MTVKIIAAVGKNRELGANNALLWRLPEDTKFFRDTTRGACVIMGRLTYESIGRPLPNRRNIIVSRSADFHPDGTEVFTSLEQAMEAAKTGEEDIFIIGGASIYRQALEKELADELILTEVDNEYPEADTFFPEFDTSKWEKSLIRETVDEGIPCRWVKYIRRRR